MHFCTVLIFPLNLRHALPASVQIHIHNTQSHNNEFSATSNFVIKGEKYIYMKNKGLEKGETFSTISSNSKKLLN